MSKNAMWRYWGFGSMDNKAAQAWLNDMAARGWALEGIHWDWFAKFVPAAEPVEYFVDWSEGVLDEEESYLRLCRDAGWEQVTKQRYLNIFRARPGTTPIQTDPAEEYRRFRAKVVRPKLKAWAWIWGIVLAFAVFLLAIPGGPEHPGMVAARMLASSGCAAALACAPFFLAAWVFRAARLFKLWREWKAAAETGTPLSVPSRRAIRAGQAASLLRDICLVLVFIGIILELIVGPTKILLRMVIYAGVGWIIANFGNSRPKEFRRRGQEEAQRQAAAFIAAAMAVTAVLHFTAGPWLVKPAPSVEPKELILMEDFNLDEDEVEREYSLLASYAGWGEVFYLTEDDGHRWNTAFSRSHWECTTDWAADAVTGLLPRGMEPVEGRTDTWWAVQGEFERCVIRRGRSVERVSEYFGSRSAPAPWWSGLMDVLTEKLEQIPR